MQLNIRKAKYEDVDALTAIYTQATNYKVSLGDMSWGKEAYTNEEIKGMIASGCMHAAFIDGELVGALLLQWDDDIVWDSPKPNAGYIHQLAIKDGFHGQDLGVQLIDWATEETRRNGRQFIRLDCIDKNEKLCVYYEKQGFTQVGIKSIPSNNYTAALYERHIPNN